MVVLAPGIVRDRQHGAQVWNSAGIAEVGQGFDGMRPQRQVLQLRDDGGQRRRVVHPAKGAHRRGLDLHILHFRQQQRQQRRSIRCIAKR